MNAATTIIIGAGPAGLALSYHLTQRGIAHTILEAGQVGESWRRRRWDSLRLVAPNWHLQLPGMPYAGDDPTASCTATRWSPTSRPMLARSPRRCAPACA